MLLDSSRGNALLIDQGETDVLITRSKRAELFRQPDGSVLKRYFSNNAKDRVEHDQRSALYLRDRFGEIGYEGWSYSTTWPLWFDPEAGAFCMEYVSGQPLSALPWAKMSEAEYHCGVWLAFYHNKVLSEDLEGLVYSDLNVHNVMIDLERKRVVAIDPGMEWGRSGHAYEDLVHHIHCVMAVLVARGKAPPTAPLEFLRGYRRVSRGSLNLRSYYKALKSELTRRFKRLRSSSTQRGLMFLGLTTLLAPVYLALVPAYLGWPRRERGVEEQ